MKDKSSFDDLETPEVATTPIDGMTDEEWAARNERQGRIVRRVCAVFVGLAVGLALASRFTLSSPYALLASWLVILGSILLSWGLAERRDDEEILPTTSSILPDWIFELLPIPLLLAIFAACIVAAIAALCAISLFPAPR